MSSGSAEPAGTARSERFTLGCAPITWNNEDLRGLTPPVPWQTVLDEVAAAGYRGTELGDGFPADPATLRRGLEARRLRLPSAWCGLALVGEETGREDLDHARRQCGYLAAAGATFVNLAHAGTPERKAFAGRADSPGAPTLDESGWQMLAERVHAAAEIARAAGLQALFHPHAGTWVETAADLDRFLALTDESLVKLCWDVGHALYGGIDPVEVVRRVGRERVVYVHLKDLDREVLEILRRDRLGFDEGIRRRVFTEVGRGCLDVAGLIAALESIDYSGWLMVEQDSTWREPRESARASREALRLHGL